MKNTHSEELRLPSGNNGYQAYPFPPAPPVRVDEDESNLDLRQLWTVVRHRMRLFAGVALGVTTVIGLWTFNQTPKYQGDFDLLIESATGGESNESFLGWGVPLVDYETKIELLSSPSVLEPIAEQIAQQYPGTTYKKIVGAPLRITQVKDTKILQVTYQDEDPEKVEYVLEQIAQGYLNYSLSERQIEINQGIEFVEELLPGLRERVDGLQERLQKFRQQYNLLDPENQAGTLSNQLINYESQYFETQVELGEARSRYQLLQNQLGLDPQEALVSSYLSESPRYQNLLNQLQEIEIELAEQSAIFREGTPTIAALEEERANLLPLLQQEAQTVLGQVFNPDNIETLASPSSLRLELKQDFILTANELQILELRRQALEQATRSLNQQVQQMPVLARYYTDIQRELEVATESLNRFLKAREELQFEAAQKALKWKIIAHPEEPSNPISPRPVQAISFGIVAGLLLGLVAAYIAERLDPVFHSSEELKDAIKLPILANIPIQKDLDVIEQTLEGSVPQLQIGDRKLNITSPANGHQKEQRYQSSPFLEAFRSLNTNIRLLGSETRNTSLVVSSSAPAEGKSTVSVHLAKAAAAMGQRVLIIDADLRRPQVHKRLGLEQDGPGLSNVIADGLDVEEVIQRVPQTDNLFVLTAGETAPDPPRLLSSRRMHQIMEHLQKENNYDLIVYDTPPLLGFADGRLLAPRTNGVVLVVKMSKTDRSALKQTIDQLKLARASVLGVVANGVSRHGHGSYYYSHYYRYYNKER
ncbi:MAG: GumC family protein [Cyanophyceae cyanobacterium]